MWLPTIGTASSPFTVIVDAGHPAGVAVLRFDFTGLGESAGDFADTNFSSNVDDLVAAAEYLEEILEREKAEVTLARRRFTIRRQFVEDLRETRMKATVGEPISRRWSAPGTGPVSTCRRGLRGRGRC